MQLTGFNVQMHILETTSETSEPAQGSLCHGVLFRAEQVLVGAMGWWSGPTSAVETDRQARVFGLILYYLCDVEKLLNLEPPSPFFKTSNNSCNGTL